MMVKDWRQRRKEKGICARCSNPISPLSVAVCIYHLHLQKMWKRWQVGKITRQELDRWIATHGPQKFTDPARVAAVETMRHVFRKAKALQIPMEEVRSLVRAEYISEMQAAD